MHLPEAGLSRSGRPSARARGLAAALVAVAGVVLGLAGVARARPPLTPLSPYTSFETGAPGSIGAPVLSPDGQRVAFLHRFDPAGGNPRALSQLFVARTDDSELRQVSPGDTLLDPRAPAWSPDGRWIYFTGQFGRVSQRELFRVLANGDSLTRLTFQTGGTHYDPIERGVPTADGGVYFFTAANLKLEDLSLGQAARSLYFLSAGGALTRLSNSGLALFDRAEILGASADGARVVYAPEDRNLPHSRPLRPYRIDRGTATPVALTNQEGTSVLEASLTPSGRLLYMASAGDYLGQNSGTRPQIYRLDTQTKAIAQLTHLSFGGAHRPTADSAATRLAFDSEASLFPGDATGPLRVYLGDGDGGSLRRVGAGHDATLSADGLRLAWVSEADSLGQNGDLSPEIFSMRTDGTDRRQHTRFVRGTSQQPAISTDGGVVVFASSADLDGGNGDGSRELYRVRPDGTGLTRLTDGPRGTSSEQPSVSADGRFIAFVSTADLEGGRNADGNAEIFRMQADGDSLQQVTRTTSGDSGQPCISADGDTVAFVTTAPVLLGTTYGSGRVAVWSNPARRFRLVTPAADRPIEDLFMDDAGRRLALLTQANLSGLNASNSRSVFTVSSVGFGLKRLALPSGTRTGGLGMSANGRWLALTDLNNVLSLRTWEGADSTFVFAAPGVAPVYPRPDSLGEQVVCATAAAGSGYRAGDYLLVSRVNGLATALIGSTQAKSPEPPVLSGDGQILVFTLSSADTLNPDGSVEVMAANLRTTPVRSLDFRLSRREAGAIELSWRVEADEPPAAFRVERAPEVSGPWEGVALVSGNSGPRYAWVDATPPAGAPWYRLTAIERGGATRRFGPWQATPAGPSEPPLRVATWPNPFRGSMQVRVGVDTGGPTRIDVFDVRGRLVRRLLDGRLPAGETLLGWDGTDQNGDRSAGGVYYLRIRRTDLKWTQTITLVRVR